MKMTSIERWRASADERRRFGGKTVTKFLAQPTDNPKDWFEVIGYGPTPGERKTMAREKAITLWEVKQASHWGRK